MGHGSLQLFNASGTITKLPTQYHKGGIPKLMSSLNTRGESVTCEVHGAGRQQLEDRMPVAISHTSKSYYS